MPYRALFHDDFPVVVAAHGHIPAELGEVLARHLLQHSGGIADYLCEERHLCRPAILLSRIRVTVMGTGTGTGTGTVSVRHGYGYGYRYGQGCGCSYSYAYSYGY